MLWRIYVDCLRLAGIKLIRIVIRVGAWSYSCCVTALTIAIIRLRSVIPSHTRKASWVRVGKGVIHAITVQIEALRIADVCVRQATRIGRHKSPQNTPEIPGVEVVVVRLSIAQLVGEVGFRVVVARAAELPVPKWPREAPLDEIAGSISIPQSVYRPDSQAEIRF